MFIGIFSIAIVVNMISIPTIKACSIRNSTGGEKCCTNFYKVSNTCQACLPGYFGDQCRYACVYPGFGPLCNEECNCLKEYCDHKDGCKAIPENLTTQSPYTQDTGFEMLSSDNVKEMTTLSTNYSFTSNISETTTDDMIFSNGNGFFERESSVFITLVILSGIVVFSVIFFTVQKAIIKCKRIKVIQSSNEASSDIYMDIIDNMLVETFDDSASNNMHLNIYDDSANSHKINIALDESETTTSLCKYPHEECEKYIYSEVIKNKTITSNHTNETGEVVSSSKETEESIKSEIGIFDDHECMQNINDKPIESVYQDTPVRACFFVNKFTESTKL